MAVNFIDYDVLTTGKKVYDSQADAIMDVVKVLRSMNSDLEQGWSNDTARAFIQRINTDHIPKLEAASAAVLELSQYVNTYLVNRKEEDSQGASSISR